MKSNNVNIVTTPDDLRALNAGSNFDETKPAVVLIHASWCHFCRELRPQWEMMVDHLKTIGMQVVEVDMAVLSEARSQNSHFLRELEKHEKESIKTIPHIALMLGTGKGSVSYQDAIDPRDYANSEDTRPKTALHMLTFIKDALEKSTPSSKTSSKSRKTNFDGQTPKTSSSSGRLEGRRNSISNSRATSGKRPKSVVKKAEPSSSSSSSFPRSRSGKSSSGRMQSPTSASSSASSSARKEQPRR